MYVYMCMYVCVYVGMYGYMYVHIGYLFSLFIYFILLLFVYMNWKQFHLLLRFINYTSTRGFICLKSMSMHMCVGILIYLFSEYIQIHAYVTVMLFTIVLTCLE